MLPATYVSNDAIEGALARAVGYRAVCTHPSEIGVLEVTEVLVLDANFVLFNDHEPAVAAAKEHAGRGGLVGLHTHHPDASPLGGLASLPNVVVAKNHKLLLFKLGRHARLLKRFRRLFVRAARSLESEVKNVREDVNP